MRNLVFWFGILGLFARVGLAENAGLNVSAAVDLVGQAGLEKNSGATDKFSMRGAEIMVYSPADHMFDGMLSFAAHDEGQGMPTVEIHEATVSSTKLIPRSRFRLGQFFLGIGRLNRFHQHDWPFITAPRVQKDFFAFEGVLDTGGEYSFLIPVPFFLEITGGITNGFVFGHDHSAGSRPLMPTHYARLATYLDLPADGGLEVGFNYVGRRANDGVSRKMYGVDLTAKWKEATVTKFLVNSEIWYRELAPNGVEAQRDLGFYIYPQYYMGRDLFMGVRFDHFSQLNLKDATGGTVKNFDWNVVPTLTYRSSEFVQFRLAYNHQMDYLADKFTKHSDYIEGQVIVILGAHPAHDF